MKNVDEVAVIDLGRPSSTQSQISIDEPDAPYLRCGTAIAPQKPIGIYDRPIRDPIVDFGNTLYNKNPLPILNDANIRLAKTELGTNIGTYTANYATLRDEAAAVNKYIYSAQKLKDLVSADKGSFIDTQRPLVKLDPTSGSMIPYDEAPSASLCYWDRPFNFYQAQCISIAQDINKINRNAQIRIQIAEQIGHSILSIFASSIRQIQKRVSQVKFWVHSAQFQNDKVKNKLADIERIFGDLEIKNIFDKTNKYGQVKQFEVIYFALGAFQKNYASDERFKRMMVAQILGEIDSTATTNDAITLINKYLTPAFLLYVSQSNFQDVFLQKAANPADVPSDVFIHYALHKEKMTLLGLNRAAAIQPILNADEQLEDSPDIVEARRNYVRRWDIQDAVKSILADIQALNDPANIPNQPALVTNIRNELVKLTRVYSVSDQQPALTGYVTDANDLSQFKQFMERQINIFKQLIEADGEFKNAVGGADSKFEATVGKLTLLISDLQKYASSQVGNKYNQFNASRLQDLYDTNARLSNNIRQQDVDGLQNYVVISSPTGTGKTVQYMLYTHALRRSPGIGIHTLIFTNNSSNCKQVFDTFRSGVAERATFVKIATENPSGTGPELCFVIQTTDDDYTDMTKEFNYSQIIIPIKDVKPYESKIINGISYAYQHEQYANDICTKRLQGYFGGVVMAPLFLYDALYSLGILDDYQKIQSVVFDEVDVFYNLQSIPEFQQFFFHHPSIFRANHVVFCSATIEPEFIGRYDAELSQYTNELFWKQYYLNTGIQDSTNTIRQTFTLPHQQLGAPIKTSIDNSVNKYIYINHGEYVKIMPDEYEIHRQYGVFKGTNYNTEQLIQRILNYYPQAIISNKPLYSFKQKDLFRYDYYFLLPINEMKPLIKIENHIVKPKDSANKAFRKKLYEETRKAVVIQSCKAIVNYDAQNPITGNQDNNTEFRIDPADPTKYKIDDSVPPIANSRSTAYVEILILQDIYDSHLKDQQDALSDIKAGNNVAANITKAANARRELQKLQSQSDLSLAKSLVLYFDSISAVYKQLRYDAMGDRIMFDVLKTTESDLPALNENVFSPTTPFYDKLITGMMRQLDIESYYNLMEADFLEGGRGLDLKALVRVYIVLPMYIGLKDRGLNYRTLKQAAGRVGRAGAVGVACITRYMYKECYDLSTGSKEVDVDATKELGGKFQVWKVDQALYDAMVSEIELEAVTNPEYGEVAQMYKQLGFQGFKQNVQLVDYLEQELADYYK